MKVYIVTDGCYSDYSIQRVFSNKEAAEEYKKWHNCDNDIEEYEVFDAGMADETDAEKIYAINIRATSYPEGLVDYRYDVRPQLYYPSYTKKGKGIFPQYSKEGVYDVYIYDHIPENMWDEEKYKDKFTKALQDLNAFIRSLVNDGATYDMIRSIMYQENTSDDN